MKLIFKEHLAKQGNVTRFVFTPENPISWQPGQYIHYTLPHDNADDRGDERWFTISSAPFEKDIWITTRITPEKGSSFKNHLLSLQPGEIIETGSPEGDFTLEDPSRNYIFVAGGIGITPLRSIINQLHHDGDDINVDLLYANRDTASIAFKDELEAISQEHENFTITHFLGEDRIDEKALKEHAANHDNPIFYVSGPEPMVEAFKTVLDGMGVDAEHAKFDYFPGYEAT
jgi:ferredoxin-NADP reductase